MRKLQVVEQGLISGGNGDPVPGSIFIAVTTGLMGAALGNNGAARGVLLGGVCAFAYCYAHNYFIGGSFGHYGKITVASLYVIPTMAGLFYMDDSC